MEALPHQFPPQPPESVVCGPKCLLYPWRRAARDQIRVHHSLLGSHHRIHQSAGGSGLPEARRLDLSFPLQVRQPPCLQSQFLRQGLQVQQMVICGHMVPAVFLPDTNSNVHLYWGHRVSQTTVIVAGSERLNLNGFICVQGKKKTRELKMQEYHCLAQKLKTTFPKWETGWD